MKEIKEVNNDPVCKNPVGDGANLVTWAPSPRFLGGYLFSKSSIVNVTSGNNNSASSLLSAINRSNNITSSAIVSKFTKIYPLPCAEI